jgi:hypothetical protein
MGDPPLLARGASMVGTEGGGGAEGARSYPNKLIYPLDLDHGTCCSVDVMGAAGRLFFFSHRGGGDEGYWEVALLRSIQQGTTEIF